MWSLAAEGYTKMGQISTTQVRGQPRRPQSEMDPMHPPECELAAAWTTEEVQEEMQRRQLFEMATACADRKVTGLGLFALEEAELREMGMPEEEMGRFRLLRCRTLKMPIVEEAVDQLFAVVGNCWEGAVVRGADEVHELPRMHGLQPGDRIRLNTDASARGEVCTVRAPVGPTSVGIRPPCRGSTGTVVLYRCMTAINLSFKNIPDAGLARLVPALGWLPCLRTINLQFNLIGDDGIPFLLQVLRQNHAICSVTIKGNMGQDGDGISPAAYGSVITACGLNAFALPDIDTVDLSSSHLDDTAVRQLCGLEEELPKEVSTAVGSSSVGAIKGGAGTAAQEMLAQITDGESRLGIADGHGHKHKHKHHSHRDHQHGKQGEAPDDHDEAGEQMNAFGTATYGKEHMSAQEKKRRHRERRHKKELRAHHPTTSAGGAGAGSGEQAPALHLGAAPAPAPAPASSAVFAAAEEATEHAATEGRLAAGPFLSQYWKDDALGVNSSVRFLNLSANSITDAGMHVLAAAVSTNGALQTLALNMNAFTDVGFVALCKALRNNTVLSSLSASGNNLSKHSDMAVRKLMKSNKAICKLSLDNTKMGQHAKAEAYGRAAENAVRSNAIKCLRVRNLTDKQFLPVAEALRANSSVEEIDMKYNGELTNVAGAKLLEILAHNASIVKLASKVGNEGIHPEMHELLAQKVARNAGAYAAAMEMRQAEKKS